MTDTPEIKRIRAELDAYIDSETLEREWKAYDSLARACAPGEMAAVLAHIDAQAAEIERLRADAGHAVALPDNAKVSGAGTASAGLPGYAGDGTGERNG